MLPIDDRYKLDRLFGMALLDKELRDGLLNGQAENVVGAFELSLAAQDILHGAGATSLEELAEAVLPHVPYD